MTALSRPASSIGVGERQATRILAAFALTLGLLFVGVAGFANADVIHNAAHDWRHSMNFPCH